MPTVSITDISGLPHFATVYQWNVTFQFPTLLTGNLTKSESKEYNARCLSTEMPSMQGQSIDIQVRGHHIRQHGIYDSTHNITLNFVETIDSVISDLFTEWRRLCWKVVSGAQVQRNDAKGQLYMERLGPDLQEIIWKTTLYGCFLESYDSGGMLDGATSDVLRPTLTLSYDYFIDNDEDSSEE